MRLRMGASSSAAAFRIKVCMLSGPAALYGLKPFRSFWAPFGLTLMFCIGWYGLCLGRSQCFLACKLTEAAC